jgi:glycyl-tRNA synthetase beta chain
MPELLIELFCEEIPARMQARAAADFARLMGDALAPLGKVVAQPFHGPRRIGFVAADVAAATAASTTTERGPRANAPPAALAGFLKKHAATQEQLRQDGDYWVLEKSAPAIAAPALIGQVLSGVLEKLPWPKSMRWGGSGAFTFARPLRRVLCLFDGAVVPVAALPAGLHAGNITEGHRFLAPAPITVASFAEYVVKLRDACVVVDAEERKRLILAGAEKIAADAGLRLVEDAGLLEEVAGLVEWPVPMLGRIDDAFMDLPPEVLRTSMRVNQRYFATTRADGSPAPHFVVIANVPGSDGGKAIVAGNERVLRARFSDARFFWDTDRKQKLDAFLPKLESVTFHAKLGTQAQRVARIAALAERIAPLVGADAAQARRAAELCKADLATGMVGEFPDLQGLMGSYYARAAEGDAVADAIRDHYAPRGPSDPVPTAPVSVAVALADKLDQLAGFFAVGEQPTGSGDPYGLRRAALGVIRLVRENGLRVDLSAPLDTAHGLLLGSLANNSLDQMRAVEQQMAAAGVEGELTASPPFNLPSKTSLRVDLLDFLADRLRVKLREEGARHDILAAILARGVDPDLVRLLARVEALAAMLETEDGKNLLAAYKRAANILRIEEKKDGCSYQGPADPKMLALPAETALHAALAQAGPIIDAALAAEDFSQAMEAMASLRQPLDTFFADVTVNAPETELRVNRLNLLGALREKFDRVADFQKIEG